MKEKLEELSLVSLKQIAKELGLKNTSTLKKGVLVDLLVETAKKDDRLEKLLSAFKDGKTNKKIYEKIYPKKTKEGTTELKQETRSEEISKESATDYEGDSVSNFLKNETQQERYERYERYITPTDTDKETKTTTNTANNYTKEEKHITRYVARDSQRGPRKSYYKSNQYDRTDSPKYDNKPDYNRNDNRFDNKSEYRNDIKSEVKNDNKINKTPLNAYPVANTDVKLEDDEIMANGILEVLTDGYGFIRCENFLPGDNDVYVSPTQIRKFNLKTGDIISGPCKQKSQTDKFRALQYLVSVNGLDPIVAQERPAFEKLTPIFPDERIHLESGSSSVAMRMVDLISPIGKGQRGMIVSQPKSGKTTLLKQIAKSVVRNNPEMHLIILLIDERPEEVTDMKESIVGDNVEVIYSTFDELPENHRRVSEMVIERAKRLVEQKQDVIILLDSITRLARAYNLTVQASGRTLSGGLDPAALHMPKKFFGAARNMREGGSLTILATALVDTGSKMDDVVFEEFKGTGNMELVLDRKLSERRVFPAIDVIKSSTRREDLLLDEDELEAVNIMRKGLNGSKAEESAERVIDLFYKTRNNADFINRILKDRYI